MSRSECNCGRCRMLRSFPGGVAAAQEAASQQYEHADTEQQAPLRRTLSELETMQALTAGALSALEDRLDGVLSAAQGELDQSAQPAGKSPMHTRLVTLHEEQRCILRRLESIHARLTV